MTSLGRELLPDTVAYRRSVARAMREDGNARRAIAERLRVTSRTVDRYLSPAPLKPDGRKRR